MVKKYNQGFSLLELMIVVLILGILLALAIPQLREPYGRYNLQSAAYGLAEDIRLHMQQTINAQDTLSTYRIKFDTTNNKYYLQRNSDVLQIINLPASVELVYTNFDWDSNGIKDHVLAFNISGKPHPRGGTVTLRDRYSGELLYVIIANITGRVRVDNKPPAPDSEYEF
ncbi:prepilin-type N-terminal cleavage/methylation domain-containing protein [Desulfolucanica intricata]|uniref:prepilin-type N-terminal cleavage/methylation domain-containing protein n=1 Tax=Desulfolucanica intricata TaxID=1285191 RepID=UPI0008330B4F|nr:prepilin-type N-terminal cleavage/methylation domain-containing protein [Desulfolucanica intricata]